MNNMRRKNVMEALELIEKARNILEEVKDEEQAAYNNLPESLQYGERGEQMQENVDAIEEYLSYLEETDSFCLPQSHRYFRHYIVHIVCSRPVPYIPLQSAFITLLSIRLVLAASLFHLLHMHILYTISRYGTHKENRAFLSRLL